MRIGPLHEVHCISHLGPSVLRGTDADQPIRAAPSVNTILMSAPDSQHLRSKHQLSMSSMRQTVFL